MCELVVICKLPLQYPNCFFLHKQQHAGSYIKVGASVKAYSSKPTAVTDNSTAAIRQLPPVFADFSDIPCDVFSKMAIYSFYIDMTEQLCAMSIVTSVILVGPVPGATEIVVQVKTRTVPCKIQKCFYQRGVVRNTLR
jgi:hypothetical protein